MAQFCESHSRLDAALNYYEQAEDYLAMVRVRCYQAQNEASEDESKTAFNVAEDLIDSSGHVAAGKNSINFSNLSMKFSKVDVLLSTHTGDMTHSSSRHDSCAIVNSYSGFHRTLTFENWLHQPSSWPHGMRHSSDHVTPCASFPKLGGIIMLCV